MSNELHPHTVAQMRKRIKDLRFRYLQRAYKQALRRRPENCKYNYVHHIDLKNNLLNVLPEKADKIRLCMFGSEDLEEWPGTICDNAEMARKCEWFTPLHTKEEIKARLSALFDDPESVATHFKDIAALEWALKEHEKFEMSWWERVRWWFTSDQVAPATPPPLIGYTDEDL